MAYTTATFARLEQQADGKAKIILAYTGNAGERPIEFPYPIDAAVMPTADFMRGQAMARLAILNNNLTFVAGARPFVGTVLDTTTPLPPPEPPAETVGTYMAASAPFTPGATPEDVFALTGSATKTIRVVRMAISCVQTSAGLGAWSLLKRSTANSGGTSALVPGVPMSASAPAATATVRQYTANPTPGTLVGSLWTGRVPALVPASALGIDGEKHVTFTEGGGGAVILVGITAVLAWNFGGAALPTGLSVQASVWWEES